MSHEETSCLNSEEALRSLNVYVECEQPQVDLYKFNGRISLFVDGEKITKCVLLTLFISFRIGEPFRISAENAVLGTKCVQILRISKRI